MNPTNTGFKPANYTTPKKKPAKKRPAKRKVVSAESFAKRNPVLSKLLDLKYRINAYRELNGNTNETKEDKDLVFDMINDVKYTDDKTIPVTSMKLANGLWNKYENKSI